MNLADDDRDPCEPTPAEDEALADTTEGTIPICNININIVYMYFYCYTCIEFIEQSVFQSIDSLL